MAPDLISQPAGRRRRWRSIATWLGAGIVGVLGLLVLLIVVAARCYEDPFDPGFSNEEARGIVASQLCPSDPNRFFNELIASQDSGYYIVYVRSSPSIDTIRQAAAPGGRLAAFTVGKTQADAFQVDSVGEESLAFMNESRLQPNCLRS